MCRIHDKPKIYFPETANKIESKELGQIRKEREKKRRQHARARIERERKGQEPRRRRERDTQSVK